MHKIKNCLVAVALLASSFFGVASAHAGILTFDLTVAYTGDQPDGFIRLTFDDAAAGLDAGEIKLTIASFLQGGENVKALGFNFNPGDDALISNSKLLFTDEAKTGTFGVNSINVAKDQNSTDLNPLGALDVVFQFANPAANRFDGSDVLSYNLKGDGFALTLAMFNVTNPGGAHAVAHIRGTDGPSGSGKIRDGGTPVPTPAALPAGMAILALAAARRRR